MNFQTDIDCWVLLFLTFTLLGFFSCSDKCVNKFREWSGKKIFFAALIFQYLWNEIQSFFLSLKHPIELYFRALSAPSLSSYSEFYFKESPGLWNSLFSPDCCEDSSVLSHVSVASGSLGNRFNWAYLRNKWAGSSNSEKSAKQRETNGASNSKESLTPLGWENIELIPKFHSIFKRRRSSVSHSFPLLLYFSFPHPRALCQHELS